MQILKFYFLLSFVAIKICVTTAYSAARNLYDDLFNKAHNYPKLLPVVNLETPVIVYMNLSLSQILEVNVKDQIIVLNVWVYQEWNDNRFSWDPSDYGGLTEIQIPSSMIWLPDLVLYNNAGGDWDLSGMSGSKVKVKHDGTIIWKPPVILKSQCEMDVTYFPFDIQTCPLKMGTWTHHGLLIDLRHWAQKVSDLSNERIKYDNCESKIDYAIDLTDYLQSYEWDLLSVTANRNIKKYPCCPEPYLDVTFHIKIRRMTLFYGLNLIFPCLSISFLTIMVFYLPTYSTQKITLCISVFLALNIFILVVFDLTPSTSRSVPLIVKYLLFTMFMVTFSIVASIAVLNFSFRQPETDKLSDNMKKIFLKTLPTYLKMRSVEFKENSEIPTSFGSTKSTNYADYSMYDLTWLKWNKGYTEMMNSKSGTAQNFSSAKRNLALESLRSIKYNLLLKTRRNEVRNEWMYMGIVIDRLFLIVFTVIVTLGSLIIFLMPPQLWSQQLVLNSKDAAQMLANSNYTRLCK